MSTRRQFLRRSLGGATFCALAPAVPDFVARTARAAQARPRDPEKILVVLQLAGGNDGLNTVVPYSDDRYRRARPTLRLEKNEVRPIAAGLGFHPQMEAFQRLYKDGHLALLQGVGNLTPNRSHGTAMAVWQTGNLEPDRVQTGWLGRALDRHPPADPTRVPALFVGRIPRPLALNAERTAVPAIHALEEAMLRSPGAAPSAAQPPRPPDSLPRSADQPLLDHVRRADAAGRAQTARLQEIVAGGSAGGSYPPLQLAANLRTVARLIRADLGIRIFFTELGGVEPGGFDNHANQAANHGALLGQLAESVAAFVRDLAGDRLLDRVLLMTFSEFGRTLQENGRRGTDHGAAAPVFLAGGAVRKGLLGTAPELAELPGGGLRPTVDFRRLYATVLERWLGVPSAPVLGDGLAPLDLLGLPG